MEYKNWKWSINNEEINKTKRKNKIKEIEERIRDQQFENLKYVNNKDNNKEICAKRLSDRDQVKQRTFNPFLCNNNYLSDLNIQEKFLRSKDSNFETLE